MAGGDTLFDGFTNLVGGQNYGLQPSLIGENQAYNLVNATVRGGYAASRPGWIKRGIAFDNGNQGNLFATSNPQGMSFYQSGNGYLVLSLGGNIFAVDVLAGFKGQQVAIDTPNAANLPKTYFSQWEDYLVIQDGQSSAIYLNGLTATRSVGDFSIPVGKAMAYGWGRGWVSDGHQIAAGDITGGLKPDGSPSNVVTFSESTFLSEGGSFSLPATMGLINGMAFVPLQDTATGQGSLLIGADYGVGSIAGGIPRDQWKSTQIQQVALLDVGWTSQSGNVLLNGDIFFRSYDGIRSYRMARAQQGINGQTPQSMEVAPYLATDTQSLLPYCSGVNFDGRVLITTSPTFKTTYCYWKGLVVLDSYPTSALFQQAPPVWEGMWDGLNIVQIVTGVFNKETRCFALVRKIDDTIISTIKNITEIFDDTKVQWTVDDTSIFAVGQVIQVPSYGYYKVDSIENDFLVTVQKVNVYSDAVVGATITKGEFNEIWELTKNSPFDVVGSENIRIKSQLWTKSYGFGNPLNSKKINQYNMWVDDVIGTVDYSVSWRPDQYPCYFPWATGSLCETNETCGEICPPSLQRNPSYKPRIMFGQPPAACNDITNDVLSSFYETQVILEWTGHMRIRAIRLAAKDTTDATRASPISC